MIHIAEGKYRIGDTKVTIYVRVLRSHVMVRVGGGWDTLSHYLEKHDPCRCRNCEYRVFLSSLFLLNESHLNEPNFLFIIFFSASLDGLGEAHSKSRWILWSRQRAGALRTVSVRSLFYKSFNCTFIYCIVKVMRCWKFIFDHLSLRELFLRLMFND